MIPARSHIAEPAALVDIATREFTFRRDQLREAYRLGRISLETANATADLWLAIAAMAGARLPEMGAEAIWPRGTGAWRRADQIADLAAARAELARARTAAIAKAERHPEDLRTDQRARDLIALAEALRAPGIDWSPVEERKAA
jgi:hypothetical protein